MAIHDTAERVLLSSRLKEFSTIVIVLLFFALISYAVIKDGLPQAGSDPLGTSVVAQNIIDYHDLFVLHGKCAAFFKIGKIYRYQVQHKDGKMYYFFPIGTPILITPLVYIGNVLGVKAYNIETDEKFQKVAVMGISFAILLVTYLIAKRFFPAVWSVSIAALAFYWQTF